MHSAKASTPQRSNQLKQVGHKISGRLRRVFQTAYRSSRARIARAVYSLPALSTHNPRKRIATCAECCRHLTTFPSTSEEHNGDWYIPVREREVVQRNTSVCLDESEALRFQRATEAYQLGQRFEFPEIFLASFETPAVESRDFLVTTRDGRILFESALSKFEVLEKNGILDSVLPSRKKRLPGAHCLLAHPWAFGYYHWIIEILPRLSILERFSATKHVPIIVPNRLTRFQLESLSAAGIHTSRFTQLDAGYWQPDRLYVPAMLGPTGNPSPHAVEWLKTRFRHTGVGSIRSSAGMFYLTRRDASQRRVLNEPEILLFLRSIGFETICPGDYPFSQQIELFRNARVVLAPHGAGLTNMVFAPAGALLIELFGDNYINGCYWALANICKQQHAYLTSPTTTLDYFVSIDRLRALLASLDIK